jgi:D-alanyl-lipoteichoic acid acyltransferase DltB (MBOAT superfamily)
VLPQNFFYPYAAIGFSDFWRRWHITLSAWLRDYLYIPLGGNRKGTVRTYMNLTITMLLGGLWHGANWTFVVWGGLHGFYLMVEKAIADIRKDKVAPIATTPSAEVGVLGPVPETFKPKTFRNFAIALFTFFLINVTWVFFRAATFTQAWDLLKSMFGFAQDGKAMLTTLAIIKVSVIVFFMVIAHWLMRNTKVLDVIPKLSWWSFGVVWASLVLLLIWSQESSSSFIYFQF